VSDFENLDYYDLLGVSRSASFDEIKRAYRREISKYHPDRFANATPEEQAYAQLRSQRLTEAYGILSDFAARSAYNRGQTSSGARAPRPTAPPQQRDHQAELYDQAIAHLNSGRLLQAIGSLRQLQQINPFYRDSAELLAAAEGQLNHRPEQETRAKLPPFLLIGGIVAGLAIVAVAAYVLNARFISISRATPGTAGAATIGATTVPVASAPTAPPAPTSAPEPTAAPTGVPTIEPTSAPTPEPPTSVPTEPPTAAPTAAPTSAPASAETGALLLADNFSGTGWASLRGPTWQVGYQNRRYRIGSDAGNGPIWSYRAAPAQDVSIGVDLQVTAGEGGMLLRFLDASNYLVVVINPSQTSYRVEQLSGGATNVLTGGQSEAINIGADATNRLVVRLRGNHLQVFVNGQQIAEADANNAPDTARFGLLVIARDTPAEAFFDNLEIHALE
jgi:hypothetical protein